MKKLLHLALAVALGFAIGTGIEEVYSAVTTTSAANPINNIVGGSIDNTPIGATTPSTGVFTTATAISASTQDAMRIAGRAGGSGSFVVTLAPTTLSASRAVTFPDAATSIPIATQFLTFSGPSAARTITLPDASFTAARTDAANSFTGTQTVTAAATQDGVALAGRAGGSGSFIATITPTTLSASRTITIPDASITVARSDAAQTFTGVQTFTNGINLGGSNLTAYATSSFTVTLTGCGSATTGTALYSEVGNMIIIDYPTLTCTSNATTKTLTGQPGALGPATAKNGLMAIVQDNGAAFAVGLAAVGSGTGVVTLSKDVNGTAFTASGTFTMKQTSLVYTAQ